MGDGAVGAELHAFVAAVTFLTRVPLARRVALNSRDVQRSVTWYPLVGAGIGGCVGGATWLLNHLFPSLLAASMSVAVGVVLTGALHLDALADTADSLAATTRERALEIMRDHAVGTYGTAAIVLDLLITSAALGAIAAHTAVITVSIAAGALSRATPVALAATLPYARASGAGAAISATSPRRAAIAIALGIAIACAATGLEGLAGAAAATAVTVLAGWASLRRLGGTTGDTLGATAEIIQILVLLIGVALLSRSTPRL